MDDLLRVQKCLHELQDAPSAPLEPVSYPGLLQRLQKLKNDVKDQQNHVRAFNFEARQLKEAMRQEIPNIRRLCHENPLNAVVGEKNQPAVAGNPGTPSIATPRLGQRRVFMTPEARITTPRRNTPISMSKFLLQSKFAARCSPAAFSKAQCQRTPARSTLAASDSTPQMPSRKRPNKTPAENRVVSLPTPAKSMKKPESTAKPSEPRGCSSTDPDSTPEMTARVSFFMNPNVGNIHKRYVAIQDQDADESTCLLSTKFAPKPSRTPELPMSCQKKPQTPHRRDRITPPLPFSSTKKVQFAKTTPEMKPNSERKNGSNRTPSPTRSAVSKARICLEAKLENLRVAPQSDKRVKELESAPTARLRGTPDLPPGRESRAPTIMLSKTNILSNRTEPLALSKTLLETPSLKNETRTTKNKGTSIVGTGSVLRDNMNSLRKKRLLAALENTPGPPKAQTGKATPKIKIPMERSSTMPVNIENTTKSLRPSKMLRNKTVIS